MYIPRALIVAFLAPVCTSALATPNTVKRSAAAEVENGKFIVDRQAEFANHQSWTFDGSGIPEGLKVSTYPVNDQRGFYAENAVVRNGYLELIQSAGPDFPYRGGEVVTSVKNIKYASVRTVAILTDTYGTCNGMFFYQSNTQETDIEWLSDPNNLSNQGTRKLWLTNQDTNGDGKTYLAIDPPANPTTTEHEYRIDWTEGRVAWFVDGEQVWETNKDVPSVPGPWIWNNWSNGDIGWSAGPPTQDAVFKVRSIDMYYNTA
ncbi:concanavalin A-like lectin/glucanase domain-containing protein [Emericellopsis atlantica]|uniref:Concanavalin A-like lectin/glucanase domain-containing protein n=1 Tax=Emericellopsis atlantica TaxID=2614577 RepID=A0A9P8CNR9_9HYPO|nr:concanavalin A-like lectin/glucanase domain-containing protein [Emericellopsis atlantica]KAG9253798.1 concanavalin A-like lectin/glucanase domain-containing protein [Emericellopsis atlantica]